MLSLDSWSSNDTFSSLFSDEFNPEGYGESDKGNCIATSYEINQKATSNTLSLQYSLLRYPLSSEDAKQGIIRGKLRHIRSISPQSSDELQHTDSVFQAQQIDIDGRHLPPSRENINPQLARQGMVKQLDHVQKPLINFPNVKNPFWEIQDVSVVDSSVYDQDRVEDTVKRNGENSIYPPLVNQEFEQEPFEQRSPATGFFSTKRDTLGKASLYQSHNQDSESDSCFELETELSSDDCSNVLSPSPSLFSISEALAPKRMLMVDVLRYFWDIYNKDSSSIISRCIALVAKDVIGGENTAAASTPSSRSASSTSVSITASSSWTTPSSSGAKRKLSEDGLPPDGSDRRPLKPNEGKSTVVKDQLASRYACPFRKHNPRKYNMHRHQRCALGSFGSIARIK